MDGRSIDEDYNHGVRTLARTLSDPTNSLPELPPLVLDRINLFCPRYSKFSVVIDEWDGGTMRDRYENFYRCRDYFLSEIVYGPRWMEDVSTHGEHGGLRSRFTFISTSEEEHRTVERKLLRRTIYDVYADAYWFLF